MSYVTDNSNLKKLHMHGLAQSKYVANTNTASNKTTFDRKEHFYNADM